MPGPKSEPCKSGSSSLWHKVGEGWEELGTWGVWEGWGSWGLGGLGVGENWGLGELENWGLGGLENWEGWWGLGI